MICKNYQSLFLANAHPECDFKYFSKAKALCLSSNAMKSIASQGLHSAV